MTYTMSSGTLNSTIYHTIPAHHGVARSPPHCPVLYFQRPLIASQLYPTTWRRANKIGNVADHYTEKKITTVDRHVREWSCAWITNSWCACVLAIAEVLLQFVLICWFVLWNHFDFNGMSPWSCDPAWPASVRLWLFHFHSFICSPRWGCWRYPFPQSKILLPPSPPHPLTWTNQSSISFKI